MKFAIATHVANTDSIPGAIALAKSIHLYSHAETICLISGNVGAKDVEGVFDHIVNGNKWYMLNLDNWDRILYMSPDMILNDNIDELFNLPVPSATIRGNVIKGDLILIQPSKFAYALFVNEGITDGNDAAITEFYVRHGYTWHEIGDRYDVPAVGDIDITHAKVIHFTGTKPWTIREGSRTEVEKLWHRIYEDRQLPVKHGLQDHLGSILSPILGNRAKDVIAKYFTTYAMCFVHRDLDPVVNYELMEAYGDRFLKGEYMWVLLRTPGIIRPDQVTKISSYFQDMYRLEEICDHLRLAQYIRLPRTMRMNTKIKSDVVEALIAAIGITWQKMHRNGDSAMRMFVTRISDMVFGNIDTVNYESKYGSPKEVAQNMVQGAYLDRSLLKDRIVEENVSPETRGKVMVVVSYGGTALGSASIDLDGMYYTTAVKMATTEAYRNVLETGSLAEYIRVHT